MQDTHELINFALSYGQEQLWFLEQLNPMTPTYNVPVIYRISGHLDHSALRQSMQLVVERHDILRTRFGAHEGVPCQTIAAPPQQDVLVIEDLTDTEGSLRETTAMAAAEAAAVRPFDLATGPLYRFQLFRLDDEDHLLVVVIHHIVCDGWSINLLGEEISANYAAIAEGRPLPAVGDVVQYRHFVEAQRSALNRENFESELDFWEKRLAGLPTLDLPADHPRPALAGHQGGHIRREWPEQFRIAIAEAAQRNDCSLSMLLTAAFAVVISRYTGEDDIAIGTTALGRTEPEWERVIGLFVNAVVLRMDMSGDLTFAELLADVKDAALNAFDHQAVPFERVVDRLGVARDASRNPLFQVLIQVLEQATGSSSSLALPGTTVSVIEPPVNRSRFDLSLTFSQLAQGLELSVEYSAELFDPWRIEQLLTHVERIVAAACADSSIRLSAIDILSAPDKAELLSMGRGRKDELRGDPAHVLVAERAAAAPESVAVMFDGDELTYGELCRRVDVLARYLRCSLGVAHEEVVAIAFDRGIQIVTAYLGVSKAGGAYVTLDIDYPVNRLEFILDDANARVVLTTSDLLPQLPAPAGRTYVFLDRVWDDLEAEYAALGGEPLAEISTGDSLVNVVYTSGTTGRPKGVLTDHRALASYLVPFVETFGMGPGDRVLQFANLAFDLCQAEVLGALTSGATLVCAKKETLHTPEALAALIREQQLTCVIAPPTMIGTLEPEPFPSLRALFVGGEACPAELANRWNVPGRLFLNGYGPTEAAIGVTIHPVPRIHYRSSPPIGAPLPNRQLYIVEPKTNALVPIGVPGELLLGGDDVLARGYLNRPDLNAEKFISDPFRPHGRVYRSGDLVRWNRDGHIEFLGRIDTQVKLRGLRIELEEIETMLLTHPAIQQAAVTMTEDARGQKILAAYYTLAGSREPGVAELRRHLGEYIPAYMVPNAWMVLSALPVSSTGKLNRKALPPPVSLPDTERDLIAPRTLAERSVAAAFSEVLEVPVGQVGVDDDFFELGGNSLQAMRVLSRINKNLRVKLGVRALYSAPNLRDFAQQVEMASATARSAQAPDDAAVPDGADALGLAERIVSVFAEVLPEHTGPIGINDNLFAMGADNEQAAAALELIGRQAGIRLTERDLYVPAVLAAALEARQSAERWSPLVTLSKVRGQYPPLFCLPGASGSASPYAGLARRLTSDRPIFGLEAPGLEPGREPLAGVHELAAEFTAAIRSRQPQGPYHLLGWSVGGLVAFEVARQLDAAGGAVAFLTLVDTQVPTGDLVPDEQKLFERFVADLAAEAGQEPPELGHIYTDAKSSDTTEELFELLRRTVLPAEIGSAELRRRLAVYQTSGRAAFAYRPAWIYPGQLNVLKAVDGWASTAREWSGLAAQVREYRAPGNHHSMWSAEHRPILAAIIDTLLAAVES